MIALNLELVVEEPGVHRVRATALGISIALHATVVSASVDGSVRLWDFSRLRNRTCNVGGQSDLSSVFGLEGVVFGHVWEGFTAKLGWVVFHPKQEMVVVVDGRMVRIYSISTYREVGSLLGHEGEIVGGVWGVRGPEIAWLM